MSRVSQLEVFAGAYCVQMCASELPVQVWVRVTDDVVVIGAQSCAHARVYSVQHETTLLEIAASRAPADLGRHHATALTTQLRTRKQR